MGYTMVLNKNQYLMYGGKPLVRQGNLMCYGDMSDKHILYMMILSNKTITGSEGQKTEIPDQILVQVLRFLTLLFSPSLWLWSITERRVKALFA